MIEHVLPLSPTPAYVRLYKGHLMTRVIQNILLMNSICVLSQISEVDLDSIILIIPNLGDLTFQAMFVNIERYF